MCKKTTNNKINNFNYNNIQKQKINKYIYKKEKTKKYKEKVNYKIWLFKFRNRKIRIKFFWFLLLFLRKSRFYNFANEPRILVKNFVLTEIRPRFFILSRKKWLNLVLKLRLKKLISSRIFLRHVNHINKLWITRRKSFFLKKVFRRYRYRRGLNWFKSNVFSFYTFLLKLFSFWVIIFNSNTSYIIFNIRFFLWLNFMSNITSNIIPKIFEHFYNNINYIPNYLCFNGYLQNFYIIFNKIFKVKTFKVLRRLWRRVAFFRLRRLYYTSYLWTKRSKKKLTKWELVIAFLKKL